MLKVLLKMNANLKNFTNMIVYGLDIFNTDKAVPYGICNYILSKILG